MQEIFLLEDLLNVLIELETLGNTHYTRMVGLTNNHELKKLFEKLAFEENNHKEIYHRYLTERINLISTTATPEYKAYMDSLLKSNLSLLKSSSNFEDFEQGYAIAISLEKETILFLSEIREIISTEYFKDIEYLLTQERQHLSYLLSYHI
jgi:rubrerythrin